MSGAPRPTDGDWPHPRRAWYSLAVLLLAYTLSYADRMVMNLLIEPIKRSLHVSDTQVSLLIGFAFGLFYVLVGLPAGYIADRIKRRNLIIAGLGGWSVMTALCGVAASFPLLFLARMGVGVGEATLAPSAYSLLSDTFPRDKLGRAVSIYAIGVPVGTGCALMLGGLLIKVLTGTPTLTLPIVGTIESWRTVFLILAAIGLPLALLVATISEPARRDHGRDAPAPRLMDTLRFMRSRRMVLFCYLPASSIYSGAFNGMIAWSPSFLIRTYGISTADAGFYYGLIFMTFGLGGLLLGGTLADRLARQGRSDGHLRTVWYASMIITPFMIAFPLAPTLIVALALLAAATLLSMMTVGITLAVMQLMTPGRFRGQMTALFLLFSTLFGVGLGPTAIALVTDHVFHDPAKLRYSMAALFLVESPIAVLLYGITLRPYRAALAAYDGELAAAERAGRPDVSL